MARPFDVSMRSFHNAGMHDEGYAVVPPVVSERECDGLLTALRSIPRSRAGARHLMNESCVRELAKDPRLLDLARDAVGPGAVPYRATLFEKSGDSNWLVVWHQDTALPLVERFDAPGWGPWSMKAGIHYGHAPAEALERIVALRLQLDDSAADNGPLRVLPGSHRLGVLADEEVFRIAREQPAVDCLCPRGGVVIMRPLLIHSSPKAASPAPRRVLHLEYAANLELLPHVRLSIA